MVDINIYPRYEYFNNILDLFPPYLANQNLPEWYKKQSTNKRKEHLITKEDFVDINNEVVAAKHCPAIQEQITGGIIIPAWTDIYIMKKGEQIIWEATSIIDKVQKMPNDFLWIETHGHEQVEHMDINKIPVTNNVFKLICPYLFETTPGYGLEFTDVMYHKRHNIKFFSGRVETDKWHETNFPFEFYEDLNKYENKTLYIKAGDPLIMLKPYKIENEKINVTLNKYSDKFKQKHVKNKYLKSSLSNNWNKYKLHLTKEE
jgi:hypothetical protein|tara:strand:- start:153 stop:932 length:780 start_codon:yes stop_codon:yes gene_type:complete